MATPPRTPTPARKEKDPLKMSYEERARANEQRLAEARKGTPAEQALPTYRVKSGSGGQAQKTQDYTVGAENLTIEASRGGGIVTVSGGTIEQQQAVSQSIAQAQRAKQDAVKAGEQAKAYLVSQQVQEVEAILKQQQALKNQSSQPKPSELPYDINKPILSPPTSSQTPFIIQPALAPATSGQETVRLPPRQVTQMQGMVTEYQTQRLLGQKQTPQELRESIVQFSEAYAPKGALKNIVQNAIQAGGEFLIVKPSEIVTAVATVTTRPKQTAQAIITANPIEVAKGTIESFKQKTAGQQVGGVAFDIASSIAMTKPITKISETVAEAIVPTPKITQARTVSIASTIDEAKTITETTGKIQTQIGKKTREYDIQSTQITKPDYDQTILIQEKGTIGAKGKTPSAFETIGQAKRDGNIILTKTDIKTDTATYKTIGETKPLTDTSTQTNILIGQKTKKGSKLIGAEYQISQDVAEKQGAYNLKAQDGQVNIEYSIPAQQKLIYGTSTKIESPNFQNIFTRDTRRTPTNYPQLTTTQQSQQTAQKVIQITQPATPYVQVTQAFAKQQAVAETAETILKTAKPTQTIPTLITTTKLKAYQDVGTPVLFAKTPTYTTQGTATTTKQTTQAKEITTAQATKITPIISTDTATISKTATAQSTRISTNTLTDTTQAVSQTTARISIFNKPLVRGGTPFTKPTTYTLPTVKESKEQKKKRRGFRVLVRKRGQFKAEGGVFSQQEALAFGAKKVSTTTSATFKLQEVEEAPTSSFGGLNFLKNFYKKGELYIQKRGTRIGTIGEKQELRQAKRTKGIFGGLRK